MNYLEAKVRDTFRKHGFSTAADSMELGNVSKKKMWDMINSWDNYPACMFHYPTTLTPKNYPDI